MTNQNGVKVHVKQTIFIKEKYAFSPYCSKQKSRVVALKIKKRATMVCTIKRTSTKKDERQQKKLMTLCTFSCLWINTVVRCQDCIKVGAKDSSKSSSVTNWSAIWKIHKAIDLTTIAQNLPK